MSHKATHASSPSATYGANLVCDFFMGLSAVIIIGRRARLASFLLLASFMLPYVAGAQPVAQPHDWESIFFPAIDNMTRQLRLHQLRQETSKSSASEIRIWAGFGLEPLQVIVLRRDGDSFSVQGTEHDATVAQAKLRRIWETLDCLGIWTLPDSESLKGGTTVADGIAYVVELRRDGEYRNYEYSNPYLQPWPEAHRLLVMLRLLERSFSLPISDLSEERPPGWVEDGKVIYIRSSKSEGAFILSKTGESADFRNYGTVDWVLRSEAGKSSKGQTRVHGNGKISFGPFALEWSSRSKGEGYLRVGLARPVELVQGNEANLDGINFDEPRTYWIAPRYEKSSECENPNNLAKHLNTPK